MVFGQLPRKPCGVFEEPPPAIAFFKNILASFNAISCNVWLHSMYQLSITKIHHVTAQMKIPNLRNITQWREGFK